jgi:hypothetical protein
MKPEIYKQWEEVVSHYRRVDEFLKDNKIEEAEKESYAAIFLGFRAIFELSQELKIPELAENVNNAISDWLERGEKHRTPKEKIEWSCGTLKRLSESFPPDIPPLRELFRPGNFKSLFG